MPKTPLLKQIDQVSLAMLANLLNPLNCLDFLFTTFLPVEKSICLYLISLIMFARYDTFRMSKRDTVFSVRIVVSRHNRLKGFWVATGHSWRHMIRSLGMVYEPSHGPVFSLLATKS